MHFFSVPAPFHVKEFCHRSRMLLRATQHKQDSEKPDGYSVIFPMATGALLSINVRLRLPRGEDGSLRLCTVLSQLFQTSVPSKPTAALQEIKNALEHPAEEEAELLYPMLVLYAFASYVTRESPDESMRFLFALKYMAPEQAYRYLSPVSACLERDPSGLYQKADRETRQLYRRRLYEQAEMLSMDKGRFAQILLDSAMKKDGIPNATFASVLLHPDRTKIKAKFVLLRAVLYVLFAAGIGMCAVLCGEWCVLAAILPLCGLVQPLAEGLISRFWAPEVLPAYAPDALPHLPQTLCVISALVLNRHMNGELAERLENAFLRNRNDNIRFGFLLDERESRSGGSNATELFYFTDIVKDLTERYHTPFYLFYRKPRWNEAESSYMGWERKRGAILQLCSVIAGANAPETVFQAQIGDVNFLHNTVYLMVLDADTEIGYQEIERLVRCAAFPTNMPVLNQQKTRVIEGYGVLQPNVISTTASVMATPFSKVMEGFGGSRIYHPASFRATMATDGVGSFCGKGLLHAATFWQLMRDAFPENAVLSHDYLEGTRLRCGFVGNLDLRDTFPDNAMSYFARQSRWIRGDVQSLPFLLGEDRKLQLTQLLVTMSPVLALAALCCTVFLAPVFSLLPLFYLLIPCFVRVCQMLFSGMAHRKTYAAVYHPINRELSRLLVSLLLLPHAAVTFVISATLGFYRSRISHRHCLAWATAGETNQRFGGKGCLYYYLKMWFTVLCGVAALLTGRIAGAFFGTMWLLAPAVLHRFGKREKQQHMPSWEISETQWPQLRQYAKETWQYFSAVVNQETGWLPPDNMQFAPVARLAGLTSPTNIGMYFLSCISAEALGILPRRECEKRIALGVQAMEKLPQWHGHLFNWFHVTTAAVLGTPYISLVDSGNFVCALVILNQWLLEKHILPATQQTLACRIDEMDFGSFYRPDEGLMSIGYDTERGEMTENEFDLYMSEARSASYFAVATGAVPASHWTQLGRMLREKGRHFGMLSWTGTAFEYFMPLLWMPAPEGSFLYESLQFAREQQLSDRLAGSIPLCGISESAYDVLDQKGNYQYHAFGAAALAIEKGVHRRVFAPYASFLMLQLPGMQKRREWMANLARFEEIGCHSHYGFYDAADATDGAIRVVHNVMSHHSGMSLCAIANVLCGGLHRRLFLSDRRMRAAAYLLEEQIPFFDRPYER